MNWSRFHDACANCGTQRRPHKSKGYCKPCLLMIKCIWETEKWDRTRSETLKKMPPLPAWTGDATSAGLNMRSWSDEEFERYRLELRRQYQIELDRLREQERHRKGHVTGWDVEFQLQLVHSYIRPKAKREPFHGIARTIDDGFDDKQLSVIYGLLLDLLDHIPWSGINGDELWRRVCSKETVTF